MSTYLWPTFKEHTKGNSACKTIVTCNGELIKTVDSEKDLPEPSEV